MNIYYENEIYDDMYHLSKCHQNEMKSIMNLAIDKYKVPPCDLSICKCSDWHYRVDGHTPTKSINDGIDEKKYFDINKEMMDSLHFNSFHLFSCGLRSHIEMEEQKDVEDEHGENEEHKTYFDADFSRMASAINKTQNDSDRFKRISGNLGGDKPLYP